MSDEYLDWLDEQINAEKRISNHVVRWGELNNDQRLKVSNASYAELALTQAKMVYVHMMKKRAALEPTGDDAA